MQIEGTPNERALLVTFSYIAGFTAAFIAFGITVTTPSVSTFFVQAPETTQVAAVGSANATTSMVAVNDTVQDSADVHTNKELRYENNGLYLYSDDEYPLLLSKDAQVAGFVYADGDDLIQKQGFHTALPHYEHFSALGHVFFCEQYDVTGVCTPYLYDTKTQQLRVFVTDDGDVINIDNRDAKQVVATSAGSYVLGAYRSYSANEPWVVVLR